METIEERWSEDMVIVADEEVKPGFWKQNGGKIGGGVLIAAITGTGVYFAQRFLNKRAKQKFLKEVTHTLDKIESANAKLKAIPNDSGEVEDVSAYHAPTTRELIYVLQHKLSAGDWTAKEKEQLVAVLERLIHLSQSVQRNEVAKSTKK